MLGAAAAAHLAAAGAEPRAGAGRAGLDSREQAVVLALLDAVDAAQRDGTDADARVVWAAHVLKSADYKAYVPFAVSLDGLGDAFMNGAVYVRAVSRPRDGAAIEQHSEIRQAIGDARPAAHLMGGTVTVNAGEMPVGGPALSSSRQSTRSAAESAAALELQRRAMDKEKEAAAAARKRLAAERDPALFPFESYYFYDAKTFRGRAQRVIGRAIPLPPGDYDLYVALVDRAAMQKKGGVPPVVLERRLTVPDFWNDELRLSSLILTSDLRMLAAPLPAKAQGEQPYTFGLAALSPTLTGTFTNADTLSIVYQICNFGWPDAELTADYRFYRMDGQRRLFNGTPPQALGDEELPTKNPWETQAFAMQLVPLASFPPGRYELEVTVHDRLTRAEAKMVAAFTVAEP